MRLRNLLLVLVVGSIFIAIIVVEGIKPLPPRPSFVQLPSATFPPGVTTLNTPSPLPGPTNTYIPSPWPTVLPPKTATPPPSPTNNGGKANWTIRTRSFTSNYPNGFTFNLDASSSAGKIVVASVTWSPAPGKITRVRGSIGPDGKLSAVGGNITASPPIPPWMPLDYWWTLTDAAGNTIETPRQYEEYTDSKRKWTRRESDDVVVFWQEGVPNDIGPTILGAMADMRPFWVAHWGKLLDFKPHIVIFATREDFASWNPELGTTAVGDFYYAGQATTDWGGTVQFYQNSVSVNINVYSLILHEVAHLYQGRSGALSAGGWFIEGNAAYFERIGALGTTVPLCVAQARRMATAGTVPSLITAPSTSYSREGYVVGCAFFHWLVEKYGEAVHLKLWERLSRNISHTDALEQITGRKFAELDVEFRTWLGVTQAVAPTLAELPTVKFPPTRGPRATVTP